jgi:hypothetical protein
MSWAYEVVVLRWPLNRGQIEVRVRNPRDRRLVALSNDFCWLPNLALCGFCSEENKTK